MTQTLKLTILMPCLNEAETLGICITKAHQGAKAAGITDYEVLIADNGSTDGSREIALEAGARVVGVPIRGYGAALKAGVFAAHGEYIIMGDSDDSYDFSHIAPFIEELDKGHALVMGSRFAGEIKPGAMPFLHKYLGNPVLTFIGNLLFRCGLSDFHCGMRAFRRDAILDLDLRTDGMEYASEMVIAATLADLPRSEVPITLHPDGRSRPPHLRTWIDGWRHLRFMLLYSPRWVFMYPGTLMILIGGLISLLLISGPFEVNNIVFDVHSLLGGVTIAITGFQLVMMGVFTRAYTIQLGILPGKPRFENFIENFSLLIGLSLGLVLTIIGVILYVYSLGRWSAANFGPLDYQEVLRFIIVGTFFIVTGLSLFFWSFVLSLLSFASHSNSKPAFTEITAPHEETLQT